MPAPLLAAAGLSLLESGVNNFLNEGNNRRQRAWSEQMYARQRADALADWNMQNEYNSPKSQMARLKDAGINPRLAFTSGVDNGGSVVRSSNVEPWHPNAPRFDVGANMGEYMNVSIQKQQLDNLEAQNAVLKQEALLKWAETLNKSRDADKKAVELGQHDETGKSLYQVFKETQLSVMQNMRDKLTADTKVALDRNEREAIKNTQSIAESVERILTLRQGRQLSESQKKSIDTDVELKNLDIQLRKKYNIGPGDPLWVRMVTLMLEKFGSSKTQ